MALTLDGSTYLGLADTAVNFLSAPVTLSFWWKGTTDTAQAILSYDPQSPGTASPLRVYVGNNITGGITDEIISIVSRDVSVPTLNIGAYATANRSELLDGAWHHVAITASGSAWAIYLDGASKTVSVGSTSNTGKWAGDSNSLTEVSSVTAFSQRDNAGAASVYCTGAGAHLRLYTRVLSATEIAAEAKGMYARPANGLSLDLGRSLRNGTGEVATLTGSEAYESGPRMHMPMRQIAHAPQRGLARRMALDGLYVGETL